ncbi:hypothetical protein GCM10009565_62130 [Amycolatopsis albidoflavus]
MLPPLEPSSLDPDQLVLPWSDTGHPATWDEVEKVFGGSAHRRSRLLLARSRLEGIHAEGIPLLAVWINGSFVTDCDDPRDIDLLVLIDGLALRSAWNSLGGSSRAAERIHTLRNERWEPGGTKQRHLTDFNYVIYYPRDPVTEDEVDLWHGNWSRLRLPSPKPGEQGRLVEDAKGFVEVRWSP